MADSSLRNFEHSVDIYGVARFQGFVFRILAIVVNRKCDTKGLIKGLIWIRANIVGGRIDSYFSQIVKKLL